MFDSAVISMAGLFGGVTSMKMVSFNSVFTMHVKRMISLARSGQYGCYAEASTSLRMSSLLVLVLWHYV